MRPNEAKPFGTLRQTTRMFRKGGVPPLLCIIVLCAVVTYISVFVQVWQGLDVVKTARKMLGETNPADSLPGTIRGDYCVEVGR